MKPERDDDSVTARLMGRRDLLAMVAAGGLFGGMAQAAQSTAQPAPEVALFWTSDGFSAISARVWEWAFHATVSEGQKFSAEVAELQKRVLGIHAQAEQVLRTMPAPLAAKIRETSSTMGASPEQGLNVQALLGDVRRAAILAGEWSPECRAHAAELLTLVAALEAVNRSVASAQEKYDKATKDANDSVSDLQAALGELSLALGDLIDEKNRSLSRAAAQTAVVAALGACRRLLRSVGDNDGAEVGVAVSSLLDSVKALLDRPATPGRLDVSSAWPASASGFVLCSGGGGGGISFDSVRSLVSSHLRSHSASKPKLGGACYCYGLLLGASLMGQASAQRRLVTNGLWAVGYPAPEELATNLVRLIPA